MLRSHSIAVEGFTSPEAFLARAPYDGVACLLLDLRMPGLSGLDVQTAMSRKGISMPIIFLSAQSDVPSTVRAMRGGAVDFLEKPVNEERLVVIRSAVDTSQIPPTSYVLAGPPASRADRARAGLRRADVLANAPEADRVSGLFKVPRVIG